MIATNEKGELHVVYSTLANLTGSARGFVSKQVGEEKEVNPVWKKL